MRNDISTASAKEVNEAKEMAAITVASQNKLTVKQGQAVVLNLSWGFIWGVKDGDLIFKAEKPEHEKSLGLFREEVAKFIACTHVVQLPDGQYGFMIPKEAGKDGSQ